MTSQTLFEKYQVERLSIQGVPFGLDEQGRKIHDVSGRSIKSSVEYMMEVVRRQTAQALPPDLVAEGERLEEAAQAALNHLLDMLNASFRDPRLHVSADYLLNANNWYSYEFSLIVSEYAKAVCGDEQFHFNRGTRTAPRDVTWIIRPFSVAQVYRILPRLTAKFVHTDIRVGKVSRDRAVIQWWPAREAERLPEQHRQAYLRMGSQVYKGIFAAIPQVAAGLPLATVRDLRSQLDGDDAFEWEFTWQAVAAPRDPRPWLGLLGSLVLLALSLLPGLLALPWQKWVALLVPIPFLVTWYGSRLRQARAMEAQRVEQIVEQWQQADEQHDQLLAADRERQLANIGLERKVIELTVLHEIGLAVASTLDLDELLEQALRTVTEELHFDRAVILLVDDERRTLTYGHASGGTPEMVALMEQLEIPLVKGNWAPARAVITGEPILVSSTEDVPPDAVALIEALQTSSFLAVPLQAKGQPVGVLMVDKSISGVPITEEDQDVLLTLGRTVAVAIQTVHLYEAVEEYTRTLGRKVEERTRQWRAANENLAREKEKLDAVLRNIADGLVVTDREARVVLTNPTFDAIIGQPSSPEGGPEQGRPAGGVLGQPISALVHDQTLVTLVQQALQYPEETRVYTANVTLGMRIYKASASALRGDGLPSGVVTVLRDVTHEVEVDRMKTDFISTVSHELRTPLTSVLGFAKLIGRAFEKNLVAKIPADDHRGQQAVQRIRDNVNIIVSEGERLTRLINDVLDIAKMEAGQIEWHEDSVAMDEVIHSAVTTTSSLADARNLPVRVEVEEGLPLVQADRDRLIQVMTNLLSNAIKFTDEGYIRVVGYKLQVVRDGTVRAPAWHGEATGFLGESPFLEPGTWLAVSVQDTGIGIAEEHMVQIFDKFKQIGDVLTGRPKGTGLGLSICKEIVEHHGGRIWVDSELEVGSTFTFVLPLALEAAPRPLVLSEVRRRVVEALPAEEKGQLILVVDDEENIRNLLRQELTEAGYRVSEAADGAEALVKARQEGPDLIVLDVLMPDISGFDVTSVLKADPATADIPILILSIVENKEKGFRLGADEYLVKPLDTRRLLRSIATLLVQARCGRGSRKVLVIDPDASVIEAVTHVLQGKGYEVLEAYDGRDGLEKARQEKPDLIILDAMISRMNDYEVLKALKHEAETRDACVIVLTAAVSPEEVAELLNWSARPGG